MLLHTRAFRREVPNLIATANDTLVVKTRFWSKKFKQWLTRMRRITAFNTNCTSYLLLLMSARLCHEAVWLCWWELCDIDTLL